MKTKISEYSTTNASNTDIEGINIDEGCAPSGINNAIREIMVHLKEFQTGSSGDPLTVAGNFVASNTATLSGIRYPVADGTNGQVLATNGSGVLSFTNAASGDVTTTGTQTLTNKTISGGSNTLTVDGTNTVGFRSIPAVGTKTSSYTLATGDVGKYVQVGSGGSITIPDATFSEGDAVSVFNNTTGNITITCSITTAYIAGTNTDKATMTLATRGVANILFISGTVCVVTGNVS